jgi:hypothetical protein
VKSKVILVKRIYILIILFLSFNSGIFSLNAQIYVAGAGVHLGNPSGITWKYFFTERDALEGMLATSWRGYSLTGMYQLHFSFANPKLRNTHWYAGAGAYAGHWDSTAPFFDGPGTLTTFGANLVFGIESTFGDYPFTFGLNWIPGLNITGHFGLNIFQAGVTGRYIF